MEILWIIIGVSLVLFVFADALMTTLVVSAGAGPLSARLLRNAWRVMLRVHRRNGESSILGSFAGSALLLGTVLIWVSLLVLGWVVVFMASDAVVDARTREPAGLLDVVYFTSFSVFTLGTGDVAAAAPEWRAVSAAASFSGLFLITLAITYLVSVVSAVVARRALAIQIHALGQDAPDIVVRGWHDGFDTAFEQQLVSLTSHVAVVAEQHLAYPVLHYFHAQSRRLAAPIAIASLDDALTLLQTAVRRGDRPQASAVRPLQYAVARYLTTAVGTAPKGVGTPPIPSIGTLAGANVPLEDPARIEQSFAKRDEHRRALHQLVASDGWSWEEV